MRYVVIDVETNGLADFKLPADDPSQPRLADLAMIIVDEDAEPVERRLTVRPDGWTMSPEITAINGLTDEYLLEHGMPVSDVLDEYQNVVERGFALIAFGAQFDMKICRGEFRRAGRDDLFERTPNICVMRACGPLGIVKASGKRGWPKLSDAHRHFYGTEPEGQHTSLGDARACLAIYQKLVEIGAAPEATIHYAKVAPAGKEG